LVSGVIETAYLKIGDFIVEYLCEFESIFEKAMARVSGAKMELFAEKTEV
jgi:hypothetical protein